MIRFADFELSAAEKALRKGSDTLALRERAFAVLLALVEQAGQVVSKRELCARAWPERDVDENNLQVEILGLRRLLGKGAIVTAPGRGYQFTLRVETVPDAQDEAAIGRPRRRPLRARSAAGAGDAGDADGRGRDRQVGARRGAGAAPRGRGAGDGCAWSRSTPQRTASRPGASSRQRCIAAGPGQDGAALLRAAAPRPRRLLLVLDGCDEAVQEIADLATAILEECPGVALLATSREVLRADGEHVYRLGPLGLGAGNDADPDVVAAAPAVADAGSLRSPRDGGGCVRGCAAVRVFLDAYAAVAGAAPRAAAVRHCRHWTATRSRSGLPRCAQRSAWLRCAGLPGGWICSCAPTRPCRNATRACVRRWTGALSACRSSSNTCFARWPRSRNRSLSRSFQRCLAQARRTHGSPWKRSPAWWTSRWLAATGRTRPTFGCRQAHSSLRGKWPRRRRRTADGRG
ncbi:MAG: winged helix-turn-helix domain-containing protein [Betaproteobacteria bacterium]|nr:winged helix-turn-helix domain-containing protein [Betaproteobacteria bacterium]